MRRTLVVVVAAVAGCGAPPVAPPAAPEPSVPAVRAPSTWRLGAYLPLSGAEAEFGALANNGIELAVAQANQHGGAKGIPVEVVVRDTHGDASDAAAALRELVAGEHVVAVLGEIAPSRSEAGGLVARELGVPMVTPTGMHADLGEIGPFMFQSCVGDDAQGRAGARFVVEKLGKKRVALIYPLDSARSKVLTGQFRAEAARLGAEIVSDQGFLSMDTDYGPYLEAARGAGAEAFYAPTFANQMVPLARQASALGIAGEAFVGADGWDDVARLREAGPALEGAYFTVQYAIDAPGARAEALASTYRARFGDAPSTLAALSYDAAKLVIDAIGRADGFAPAAIRDALARTSGFEGATGSLSFGAGNDAKKSMVVVKVRGGVPHFFATVSEK